MKRSPFSPWLFVGVVCLCAGSVRAQSPPPGLPEGGSPAQKIRQLERKVFELEEDNALLMENLSGCMEENEALEARLGEGKRTGPTENKLRLIAEVRVALSTDSPLDFLVKLDEGQLRVLLGLIRKRAE